MHAKPKSEEEGNKMYPGKWQALEAEYSSPEYNEEVAGMSENPFAQKQIEKSARIVRATHYLVSGFSKENPMEGAEHAFRFCKEQGLNIPRTKIKEVINTTEPFQVATSLTVSYAFPIGEMGVTISGEAAQDSNPPTFILPLTARYSWEKKGGREPVQCQFFGQAIQLTHGQLQSCLPLGLIRGIPSNLAGSRWAQRYFTDELSHKAESELLVIVFPYSPQHQDGKKFSRHFVEPMLLILAPPIEEKESEDWERRLLKRMYGSHDFNDKIVWYGGYPIQVIRRADCFANQSLLLLPDPILAHRVPTATITIGDDASYLQVLERIGEIFPSGVVDAIYVPRTAAKESSSPEVWIMFHPSVEQPAFR